MAARAAVAKVKIAQKELGIDDDTYRAILERITGQRSAAQCSDAELGRVLDEFKAKGWAPKVVAGGKTAKPEGRKAKPADHPSAKKARAMWISLHQLGVVRNGDERALEAFAARQLKVERLQWADQGQVYKLIEALKAMAERAGWSQDLTGVAPDCQVERLKRNLLWAMQHRLIGFADGLAQQLGEGANIGPAEGLDGLIRRGAAAIAKIAPKDPGDGGQ